MWIVLKFLISHHLQWNRILEMLSAFPVLKKKKKIFLNIYFNSNLLTFFIENYINFSCTSKNSFKDLWHLWSWSSMAIKVFLIPALAFSEVILLSLLISDKTDLDRKKKKKGIIHKNTITVLIWILYIWRRLIKN